MDFRQGYNLRMRRFVMVLVVVGIGGGGCTKKDKTPADVSSAEDAASPASPAEQSVVAERIGDRTPPLALPATKFESSVTADLDMVPASGEWVLVREPRVLAHAAWLALQISRPASQDLVEFAKIVKPDLAPGIAEFAAKHEGTRTRVKALLDASNLDLERPALILPGGSESTVVFAARGKEGDTTMQDAPQVARVLFGPCVGVPPLPGYFACGGDAAEYRPGGAGETHLAAFTSLLDKSDVERANLLAAWPDSKGGPLLLTTDPGRWRVDVGLPENALDTTQGGSSPMLGFTRPGHSFGWGRLRAGTLAKALASVTSDSPAQLVRGLEAIDGEVLVGDVGDSVVSFVLKVRDPNAALELLEYGYGLRDQIPEAPPADPELRILVERSEREVLGKRTSVFTLRSTGGRQNQTLENLGLESRSDAAVVGNYMVIQNMGHGDAFTAIAAGTDGGLSPEMAELLPVALVEDLKAKRVEFLAHMEMDALSASSIPDAVRSRIAFMTPQMQDLVMKQMRNLAAILAPLSTVTCWANRSKGRSVARISFAAFGANDDPEGRRALDAVRSIIDGADPVSTYDALANEFAISPQAVRYEARTGRAPDYMALSAFGAMGIATLLMLPSIIEEQAPAPEDAPR